MQRNEIPFQSFVERLKAINYDKSQRIAIMKAEHRAASHRLLMTVLYSWAIPDERAIKRLVELSPIVEIGAGTGYWAKLIADAGGVIEAGDIKPVEYRDDAFLGRLSPYYPVLRAGPSLLNVAPESTLFLCWPNDEEMVKEAIELHKGRYAVYVGEECCADFEPDTNYELIETINIPHWPDMKDRMYIYERKR